jgi:hypothetical protein
MSSYPLVLKKALLLEVKKLFWEHASCCCCKRNDDPYPVRKTGGARSRKYEAKIDGDSCFQNGVSADEAMRR